MDFLAKQLGLICSNMVGTTCGFLDNGLYI